MTSMKKDTGNDERISISTLKAIRRSVRDGGCSEYLEPYIAKSRIISQTIHPFMNIYRAFYAGMPEAAPADEENESDSEKEDEDDDKGEVNKDDEYTEEERRVFKAIMKLERNFQSVVDACATDTKAFLGLIGKGTSNASRGDDTAKLKGAILDLMYENPKTGSRFTHDYDIERLSASDSKQFRGFLHLDTADHLCPLRLKDEFEMDPVALTNNIIDGEVAITNDDFPSFMYETGTEYDPNDETKGLFRGFLLVRVFRHIFTGPSSAIHATHDPNKTKAKIFRIKNVTGRMIAYAAVQTYLALSSAKKWTNFTDRFDLDTFYDNIVTMFDENAHTQFIKDTVEWWEAQVPGLRSVKKKKNPGMARPERSQEGPNLAERLKAQLYKQEQRRQQELQPTTEHQPQDKRRGLELRYQAAVDQHEIRRELTAPWDDNYPRPATHKRTQVLSETEDENEDCLTAGQVLATPPQSTPPSKNQPNDDDSDDDEEGSDIGLVRNGYQGKVDETEGQQPLKSKEKSVENHGKIKEMRATLRSVGNTLTPSQVTAVQSVQKPSKNRIAKSKGKPTSRETRSSSKRPLEDSSEVEITVANASSPVKPKKRRVYGGRS